MAGALRKTMVYLGLAEDGQYDDDYYDEVEDYPDDRDTDQRRGAQVTALPQRDAPVASIVRQHDGAGVTRITTIHPRTYNEAKVIGENFRDGVPVIMNLTEMGDADAKRLVDFAAGLVFGLHGAIERVTAKVFLLSPSTLEVETEQSEQAPGRVLFNQS